MGERKNDKPTFFVVACSDARLSPNDGEAWHARAGVDGDVFEVRLPGGALVLAEPYSTLAQSVLDSFQLLSTSRKFDHVVLTCHEDCAYYRLRYAVNEISARDEGDAHRYLMRLACERIESLHPKVSVREVYIATRDDSAYDPSPNDVPAGARNDHDDSAAREQGRRLAQAATFNESDRVLDELAPLAEGLPQEVVEQTLYDSLLNRTATDADAAQGPGYAKFAEQLITAKKVEQRTREFLEMVRAEAGVRSEATLRKLGSTFISQYGKGRLSQSKKQSILEQINFKEK